ncbi:conjugal transfer protein TraD [Bradyrhizobium cenepequi]
MRTWQVERRRRTRHLIELGGLIVKAGIVDLTGDDRAVILGALLWMADKLKSDQHEQARALWATKGKQALAAERGSIRRGRSNCFNSSSLTRDNGTSPDRA